ncbi:transglutaminaseTgpA domain-containing protein [Streptomyces sp. NPDC088258]|uniref:transglutaminase TgpA family protein n=1 Tax=Streptomyces sp. NPDC088258 TaxID=3365849 RepID=UPI0038121458
MSGRGRLALCALAATLMSAGALVPLVEPAYWLLQAGCMVGVMSGVGALARRVPLARATTVALQGLSVLLMLTVAFARDRALLGFVPTPGVLGDFVGLLTEGGDDVGRYAIPAPATDGIRLMLIGGVLLIGLAVDAIAVTFRSAAAAGLPLLALYSVAAGLSGGAGGWLWFLLAAVGYLLLLLAEGRDRLSQWGRIFGGTRAPGRFASGPEAAERRAPVRTGRRIGVVALGVALAVPAALPALDGGLLAEAGGGRGSGSGGGTISAVNPLVSLQDNLNQPEDREALRYKTNAKDTQDLYLRIMALDKFDGTSWRFSQRSVEDVPKRLPGAPGLRSDVSTTEVTTNISAAGWYRQNYLPMPYPATEVEIAGRWRFEPTGRTLVGDRGQSTRGARYEVGSLLVRPTKDQLASAPEAPTALRREYTRIPAILPDVVRETALSVTEGATNDYERAVRLQDWFALDGGFSYNTEVDSGTGVAAITRFLQNKEGFCVHFSFAMAAMARTLGIPARVAVGFTPGTPQSDGSMSVGLRDAHAWPEVYFEGVGWTRFEPTPSRGSAPDYTRPDAPVDGPTDPSSPDAAASDTPSAEPSASDSCPAEGRQPAGCGAAVADGAVPPTDAGPPVGTVAGIVLGALAILLIPLLPLLWRLRVRALRLGPGRRAAEDASARTLAAWREITDTAWDHGVPPDGARTPRSAAAEIVRLGGLEGPPAEAVHRVAGAVERVLYAPEPRPGTGLAEDARLVRAGLRAASGRWTRLRALLAPRSSVRVVWAVSEGSRRLNARWAARLGAVGARWSAATGRWRPSRQRG